jgi:hypothetical protein
MTLLEGTTGRQERADTGANYAIMLALLSPAQVNLLRALASARARGERPSVFYLATVLETGLPEIRDDLANLFAMGRVEWEIVMPGVSAGKPGHVIEGDRCRLSPRITRQGLDDLRSVKDAAAGEARQQEHAWQDAP